MPEWIWYYIVLAFGFALINAFVARKRGYFFWRTFFFSLLLGLAVFAILAKLGG